MTTHPQSPRTSSPRPKIGRLRLLTVLLAALALVGACDLEGPVGDEMPFGAEDAALYDDTTHNYADTLREEAPGEPPHTSPVACDFEAAPAVPDEYDDLSGDALGSDDQEAGLPNTDEYGDLDGEGLDGVGGRERGDALPNPDDYGDLEGNGLDGLCDRERGEALPNPDDYGTLNGDGLGGREQDEALDDEPIGTALQGASCLEESCAPGLECIEYDGFAGPDSPRLASCEIRCGVKPLCPADQQCVSISDGPGTVCR